MKHLTRATPVLGVAAFACWFGYPKQLVLQ